MKVNLYIINIIWIFHYNYGYARDIQKRQIYREQVLPHVGGKIPEAAFETDRLALNRLQKEGIAIPDGVLLEQRNPQVYQYSHKAMRPVFHVHLTSDNRYTPAEGKLKNHSPSIDTTYTVPQVAYHKIMIAHQPVEPSHKQLIFPNHLLKGHPKIQAIKSKLDQNSYIVPAAVAESSKSPAPTVVEPPQALYSVRQHQSSPPPPPPPLPSVELPTHFYSPIPPPASTTNQLRPNYGLQWNTPEYSYVQSHPSYKWQYFQNDYVASNILNDFETFFNNIRHSSARYYHHQQQYFSH